MKLLLLLSIFLCSCYTAHYRAGLVTMTIKNNNATFKPLEKPIVLPDTTMVVILIKKYQP